MLPQHLRLSSKDVRYIQKQRNIVWTKHFGVLRIKQYANRGFHQWSIYIAADTVKKAARRHELKRQLLEQFDPTIRKQSSSGTWFFKVFVFLNKKNIHPDLFSGSASERHKSIAKIASTFIAARKPRLIKHPQAMADLKLNTTLLKPVSNCLRAGKIKLLQPVLTGLAVARMCWVPWYYSHVHHKINKF